jgi:hypothetical protein
MSSSLAHLSCHHTLYKGVTEKMYLLCVGIVCRQYKKMYQNSPPQFLGPSITKKIQINKIMVKRALLARKLGEILRDPINYIWTI